MRISDWSSDVCSSDLNRGRFRGWPQAQIDAKHITVAVAGAQQFDDAPADPLGCVDRIFPRAARQGLRIEEEDRIDVRTVVQFTAAMLAKRDHGKSARFGVRHTRSEEHTSELQSLMRISYAVFCLKKK